MQRKRLLKKLYQAAMSAVVFLCLLSGCKTPDQYKQEADEEVYNIIDQKWKDDFGPKANYVIKDANNPDPGITYIDVQEIPKPISLVKAVEIATANNRNYQLQKEDLYISALNLTLNRHNFAMQWFGAAGLDYAKNSSNDPLGTNVESGFQQMLATGAVIKTRILLDWTRFLNADRSALNSLLSASITQPLLRGAGKEIAQENLTQAERKVLYQIREFSRYRKKFVVETINEYYKVLQQNNRVFNEKNNYDKLIKAHQRLKMEAQAGRRNAFEVDQAEQNKLSARENYISAQQGLEQITDQFKIRLAIPTTAEITLDPNELKILENEQVSTPEYSVREAIDTSLTNRLDLANTRDYVDDAARKIIVAENNLKADLGITAKFGAESQYDDDFGEIQFGDDSYGLGINADLPFDRKSERNDYRQALIALEQSQRNYEQKMDNVKLEVRQAYRRLIELAETYQIQKLSLKLAEKRVESTSLLLQAGRAQTRDLLDSQSDLLRAQNNLTAALVDHAIGKLTFFKDIGVLQVKPDGMWTK